MRFCLVFVYIFTLCTCFSYRKNVFEAHFEKFVVYGIRLNLETLSPGLWLDANVIDCWGAILNYEERFRAADSKSRHFFPTGCIVSVTNL